MGKLRYDHNNQVRLVGDWRPVVRAVRPEGGQPVFLLALPGLGIYRLHAFIRRTIERAGFTYAVASEPVLDRAGINQATIEVIESTRSAVKPQALIRAEVPYSRHIGGAWRGASRTAYFLSGYDANEFRPSYFFCELPPGVKPKNLQEAYEALKPEAVVQAEKWGRPVKRQGDIFAIPVTDLPTGGSPDALLSVNGAVSSYLLGTNHLADDVAWVGGQTYARGDVKHSPAGRPADHQKLRLGKRWHLIVPNTVPISGR